MNAQQLKNAILQEAIEGRLVPQDPNDEPASALLERIRKEKEELVKAGKLKKKDLEVKPISKDEIPFEIPESWDWVRLKDIVVFLGGYAYDSTSFISSSNNQVLRLGNVKNDDILLKINPVFIDDKLAQDTEKYKCKENDILITMTGTRKKRDYFFSVLVNRSHHNLFINQRVGCLRSIDVNIAKWLIVALKAESILTDVFQYETGTANQGNLGAENILKTKIPLPPLAEQHRIVAKIEELLPKVEEYGKAQDALNKLNAELPERLKKSILQEAVSGRLVPQDPNDEPASVLLAKIRKEKEQLVKEGKLKKKDLIETPITEDEIPFEIPESWEWVKLINIGYFMSGQTPKTSDLTNSIGGVPYFKVSDMNVKGNESYMNKATLFLRTDAKYKLFPQNAIIYPKNGGALLTNKKRILVTDSLVDLNTGAFIPSNELYIEYIFYLFSSIDFRKHYKGTALPTLNMESLNKLLFPLPPLAEQHRIVEKLEQLLSEIDKLKK